MDYADRLGLPDAVIDRLAQTLTDVEPKIDETGDSEELLVQLYKLLVALQRDPAVCRQRALKTVEKQLQNLAIPDFGVLFGGLPEEVRRQAVASKESQYRADAERRTRAAFYTAFTKEQSRVPKFSGEQIDSRAERAATIAGGAMVLLPQIRDHIQARISLAGSAVEDTLNLDPASLQALNAWKRTVRSESFAALTEMLNSMTTLGTDRSKVVAFRLAAGEFAAERLAQISTVQGTRLSGPKNGSTSEHADALALLNAIRDSRKADRDTTLVTAVEVVDALQTVAETLLGGEATVFRRPQNDEFPLPGEWVASRYSPMRIFGESAKNQSADLDARLRAGFTAGRKY